MDREKEGELEARARLRINVLRDTDYLLHRGSVSESDIYYLIKDFLKKYLNLNYEFTKDELLKEMKNVYLPYNVRNDFLKLVDNVFVFEYAALDMSKKDLKVLLKEFKSYVDYLLVPQNKEEKKMLLLILLTKWKVEFLDYIKNINFKFNFRKKELKENSEAQSSEVANANGTESSVTTEMEDLSEAQKQKVSVVSNDRTLSTLEDKPLSEAEEKESPILKEVSRNQSLQLIDDHKSKHVDMNGLIEKIYTAIYNKDLQNAAEIYKDLTSLYDKIPSEDQAVYYATLKNLYEALSKE